MKTDKRLKWLAVGLTLPCLLTFTLAAQTNIDWSSASDAEVMLQAVEQTTPAAASSASHYGNFYSAQHAPGTAQPWPPMPGNPKNLDLWNLGDGFYLLDDLGIDYSPEVTTAGRTSMMSAMDAPAPPGTNGTNINIPQINAQPIDYGTNLYIANPNLSAGVISGMVSNSFADIPYEIQYKTDLTQTQWQSLDWFVYGSELTNWTAFEESGISSSNLFLRIRSWQDDGSSLPIWWQQEYFGVSSGVDPYGDPMGDGWNNLQKFQNGMNPNVYYTPPAPQNVTVYYNANAGTATVSWSPSPGPVTSYTVNFDGTDYNVAVGQSSLTENFTAVPYDMSFDGPNSYEVFDVQANYTGGSSPQTSIALEPDDPSEIGILPAPQGFYLSVSATATPAGTAAIRLTRIDSYAEMYQGDSSFDTYWDIPLSSFTNGLYLIPAYMLTTPMDGYGQAFYSWYVQTINADGGANSLGKAVYFNDNDIPFSANLPFYDGRAQLKQNLIFQLREPNANAPFNYTIWTNDPNYEYSYQISSYSAPATYAYAGFYDVTGDLVGNGHTVNNYRPFEDNYLYRNFVFNVNDVDQSGNLTTGAGQNGGLSLTEPVTYQFDPATSSTNALLPADQTQWLASFPLQPNFTISSNNTCYDLAPIGITYTLDENYYATFALASDAKNYFGLPIQSVEMAYQDYDSGNFMTGTLSTGSPYGPTWNAPNFYPQTAQPQFQTVEYDFWEPKQAYDSGSGYWLASGLPSDSDFSPTNQSDLLFDFVGSGDLPEMDEGYGNLTAVPILQIAGYAKLSVQNGYSGVYGYLGQYFDAAYQVDDNGNVTTNQTGVLTPYGSFFPTQPGTVALVTMPDVDTGERGTGMVYVVKLQLDVNHDGNMDLSWNGPDNTSSQNPFVFWANNNFDRWLYDPDDNTNYEDDLDPPQVGQLPAYQQVPDDNYVNDFGQRVIPDTRDLEDFTRLWVCGVTSNLLAALPAGSTVTLNWGDVGNPNSGNPTIDLFQAADSDGGIDYLTNETTATEQIDSVQSPYIRRLGPGDSIQLNASELAGSAAHFIWCGVSNGTGGLNLTIADGNGNILVQSTAYIQIEDIKDMYERWTVGDNPNQAPTNAPTIAANDLPDPTQPPFQYPLPTDTNTPYILFVHGWNMTAYDKDRFAETAFKRLYWQGYQGRFGEFRWPTDSGFKGTWTQLLSDPAERDNFDNSEYNAWQSGQGLLNLLTGLNAEYTGQVYMLAHSMGNIVAGEALRLSGTNQLVNTYVASQAAVTAHAYDSSLSNSLFTSKSPTTPNIYGDWFANDNGGGAGQIISFYNTNDYALAVGNWGWDEQLKPDQDVTEGSSIWYYGYDGSASDPSPWNHFFKSDPLGANTVDFDIVNVLTNRYEVMGYAAQAYTTALGATPDVRNVIPIDLTSPNNAIWPTDPTGKNYVEHFWHSAEFRGDNAMMENYWNELLSSEAFRLK